MCGFFATAQFIVVYCCLQQAQLTYSDIDSDWKMLERAAAEVLESCETEQDQQFITDHLVPLRTKLAQVEETVEHKAAAQESLMELSEARKAAKERTLNLRERLKDDTVTVDEMKELRADPSKARSQLMELESRHPEMEALMTEAGLTLKDREMEDEVNVKTDLDKLLSQVDKDDAKLKVCGEMAAINERLNETDSQLNELSEVYTDDVESLQASVQVLNFIFVCLTSTSVLHAYDVL